MPGDNAYFVLDHRGSNDRFDLDRSPIATIRESEGLTLVTTDAKSETYSEVFQRITLKAFTS